MAVDNVDEFGSSLKLKTRRRIGLKPMILRLLGKFGLLRVTYNCIESYRAFGARTLASGSEGLPVPSPRLIVRVAGHGDGSGFLESGRRAAASIEAALDRNGVSIAALPAILDFGCGCGRVLRYWQSNKGRIYGTDISEPAIDWCRANLPFGEFSVNGLEPPLPHPDSSFDLIYALSVFTHLPVATQFAWRDELKRTLRPGGYLLLTVHGEAYVPQLTRAERAVFDKDECVVRWAQVAGSNMCGTYHPVAFVRDHLAQGWELIEHVPRGALGNPEQDLIVLRKPANNPGLADA